MLATITPTITPALFVLPVTKVATIADWDGAKHRYYVRNFTLVAKIAA